MNAPDDAYGRAIRDYYDHGEGFEIIERDDGYIEPSGGPELYFSDFEDWGEDEQAALEHLQGAVLDVGCGAGRHALYAQQQGHDVTGIDVSPGANAVSRERGVHRVVECDIAAVADRFDADSFETVLMLGNNFGLVGTAETAPTILEALATVTTEDGQLLAQSRDVYETDDQDHLDYHAKNEARGRLPGALRIRTRYKMAATDWFDYLLASPGEMEDILETTAWTRTDTWHGANGQYTALLEKTD